MNALKLIGVAATATTLALAGCAEPPRATPRPAAPEGSVYVGWRVFHDKCAACHGPAANGSNLAPDLLPSMRDMGPRRFASIVLQRYDWGMPAGRASADPATRENLVDEVLRREDTALAMPAWKDEPSVSGHIADLYAYLVARADGRQGTGKPER